MMIKRNVPLAHLTTFKIGGSAKYFSRIKSIEELRDTLHFARTKNLPIFILGEGSNILISDKGFNGLVIKIELSDVSFKNINEQNVEVVAGAGNNWDKIVEEAIKRSLYGIENLSYIPGTVGGAVAGNIGAYGMEIKDAVEWVEVFDTQNLKSAVLKNSHCKFGYRESVFKTAEGKNNIITKVCLKLEKNGNPNFSYRDIKDFFKNNRTNTDMPALSQIRGAIRRIRSKKFPDLNKFGTSGSFFKNPLISNRKWKKLSEKIPNMPVLQHDKNKKKIPLAWLIDIFCMKGLRSGDVGLFQNHSLVIVNYGSATAMEVKFFSEKIAHAVFNKTKIKINPEIIFVGDF